MTRTHVLFSFAALLGAAALVAQGGVPATPSAVPAPAARGAAALPKPLATNAAPLPAVASAHPRAASSVAGPLSLSARLSSSRVQQGASEVYLEATVKADGPVTRTAERRPVNLVVAIDRSGSMAGAKLTQARAAAQALVAALGDADRLAVVSFGSDVEVFPSTRADERGRRALSEFVGRIDTHGGTNISGALEAAWGQVRLHKSEYAVSRVVLLSDGQPTEGITDSEQLLAQVARARDEDVTTSAFGVGLDFNATLMRGAAERGAGYYAFIEEASQLARIFEKDLTTASSTVARRVVLEVNTPPGVAVTEVFGRSVERVGTAVRVGLYDFSPGKSTQLLLRLQVDQPAAAGAVQLATVTLSYLDLAADRAVDAPVELSADAVASQPEVEAGADAEVVQLAKKMDVARHLAVAAQAYERGDRASALLEFTNIRRLFGMSADALAGDDLAATEQRMRSGSADGSRAAKELTDKAMKNFGHNNSY